MGRALDWLSQLRMSCSLISAKRAGSVTQGAVAEDHVEQQRLLVGKAAQVDGKAALVGINLVTEPRQLRRVGEGVEVVGEQLHREACHGDVARALDRMLAVDGDVEVALGHAELMLVQVPEPKTGPINQAGGHVGGELGRAHVEPVADEGVGSGRASAGSGSLCCQRIFSASVMVVTL